MTQRTRNRIQKAKTWVEPARKFFLTVSAGLIIAYVADNHRISANTETQVSKMLVEHPQVMSRLDKVDVTLKDINWTLSNHDSRINSLEQNQKFNRPAMANTKNRVSL